METIRSAEGDNDCSPLMTVKKETQEPEIGDNQSFVIEWNQSPSVDEMKIPRPPNAFMIYGKEFRKILQKENPDLSNKEISKILGNEWKLMCNERKSHYHKLADQTHKEHLIKYPGYYYCPLEARQKKAMRRRRPRKSCIKSSERVQTSIASLQHLALNRPTSGTPMPNKTQIQMTEYGSRQTFMPPVVFGGCRSQTRPVLYVSLQNEHNYSLDPQQQEYQQEVEVETEQQNAFQQQYSQLNQYSTAHYHIQSNDLSSLMPALPPMHNPCTEVEKVVENEDSDYEEMDAENEDNAKENKGYDNEVVSNVKNGIELNQTNDNKDGVIRDAKVIVKRLDQSYGEIREN